MKNKGFTPVENSVISAYAALATAVRNAPSVTIDILNALDEIESLQSLNRCLPAPEEQDKP